MEHPFAEFIRALGRGKRGARDLTEDEAFRAFNMILAHQVKPEQIGAFLMLLRVKEETGTELAGFIRAARAALVTPKHLPAIDLDWSSYAGKRRQLPWYLLSILLLAKNGVRIFVHGLGQRDDSRLYTRTALRALGYDESVTTESAVDHIDQHGFAFMSLDKLAPNLAELLALRDLMGLRSPVNSVVRALNPLRASHALLGIFHPSYLGIHRDAAIALQESHVGVIKGEGGEIERNPDVLCELTEVHGGEASTSTFPALFSQRHMKDPSMDTARLAAVWRGEMDDEYGVAATIGTTAVALKILGRATNTNDADKLAHAWWRARS